MERGPGGKKMEAMSTCWLSFSRLQEWLMLSRLHLVFIKGSLQSPSPPSIINILPRLGLASACFAFVIGIWIIGWSSCATETCSCLLWRNMLFECIWIAARTGNRNELPVEWISGESETDVRLWITLLGETSFFFSSCVPFQEQARSVLGVHPSSIPDTNAPRWWNICKTKR